MAICLGACGLRGHRVAVALGLLLWGTPALAVCPADDRPADLVAAGCPDIPIWKTIRLGQVADRWKLFDALDKANIHIGTSADEILHRPAFTLSAQAADVHLVVLSVAQMGFGPNGASLRRIYERARRLGLDLCATEIGPLLRLTYLDQPVGEFLHIAMQPMLTWTHEAIDLTVANAGTGLLLIGGNGSPDVVIPAAQRFVFIRPERLAVHSHRNESPLQRNKSQRVVPVRTR